MKAHRKLVHNGSFDEVLYTSNDEVLEGTTFSFFIVADGEVKTPKADGRILGSITRMNLLRIMKEKNIKYSETTVLVDDILKADEAFIASANRDLIPVTSINGKKIGNGKIGSNYKQLMNLYLEEINK
jgi:branched-subunit amino acid aminotransferase/4-amino-4-deoxychorismate lyase